MNDRDQSVACYYEGFCCSQAVLSTFGPLLGLDSETALKVSAAFGAGISGRGETCGVVIAGLILVGLRYGKTEADDDKANEFTNYYSTQFLEEFTARNGSVICKELLECDISTSEGCKRAKEKNIFEERCPKIIQKGEDILREILFDGAKKISWRPQEETPSG